MNLTIDKISFDSIHNSFDRIAGEIFKCLTLIAGQSEFQFTEIEFYYFHPEFHADPFVHKNPQQQTELKWYFHAAGLDVTIGNGGEPGVYSSFLLRGIKKLATDEYTNGPLNVVTRIFEALGSVENGDNRLYIRRNDKTLQIRNGHYSIERVGLLKQKEKNEDFFGKKYRYIINVVPEHKFYNKEKLVKDLFHEGKIEMPDVKYMLGYYFKNQ